jgi:hypothetical protein
MRMPARVLRDSFQQSVATLLVLVDGNMPRASVSLVSNFFPGVSHTSPTPQSACGAWVRARVRQPVSTPAAVVEFRASSRPWVIYSRSNLQGSLPQPDSAQMVFLDYLTIMEALLVPPPSFVIVYVS